MNDLNQKVKKEAVKIPEKQESKAKGVRHDIEEEDDEESYYRYIKENPLAGLQGDDSDSEQIEYDEDGNPIKLGKKHIDPLPPIDHSSITYAPFEKNFYEEHDEIKNLPVDQANSLREKIGLRVTGVIVPKPVCSFAHFSFDEKLLNVIRKSEFTNPTPIQVNSIGLYDTHIRLSLPMFFFSSLKQFLLHYQVVTLLVSLRQAVAKRPHFSGQ